VTTREVPKYDFSREALYHPERRPVFVGFHPKLLFEEKNLGLSYVNTWWLSNASHLAYFETKPLKRELDKVGLRLETTFSGKSTQGFLASNDAFAILAFRGTQSEDLADIKADLNFRPEPFMNGARVHQGFLLALDEVWRGKVDKWLAELNHRGIPVWYTGHSLGAALATLAATRRKPAALVTFGSPRVGDEVFTSLLREVPTQRFVNCCDIVATLAPQLLGYRHVGDKQFITARGRVLTNPGQWRVLGWKVSGLASYALLFPWLRPGMVKLRSAADHAVLNYTAGIWKEMAKAVEP
jgi:triacylglycerol lipase